MTILNILTQTKSTTRINKTQHSALLRTHNKSWDTWIRTDLWTISKWVQV